MVEALVFCVAVYAVAGYLVFPTESEIREFGSDALLKKAVVFAAVMMVGMTAMGLYQSSAWAGRSAGILARTAVGVALGCFGLGLLFVFFPSQYPGWEILVLAVAVSFFGVTATGKLFTLVISQDRLKRRVLVLGAGETAARLLEVQEQSTCGTFCIVAFVRMKGESRTVDSRRVVEIDEHLIDYARRHRIDEIVVAVSDRRKSFSTREVLDCRLAGIRVVDALSFFERETGQVILNLLQPSWMIFSDGFVNGALHKYLKRLFDVAVSVALLVMMWPAMAITALAIMIESGPNQPVLFRQMRVGQNGRLFQILKFRSMRIDAEADGVARWAKQNDDRVTLVGRLIRKIRIDELPQLYNVLRGDMSFVGPRPERPEFVASLAQSNGYYCERHRMKPGITGWAQLRYPYGASEEDALNKLQYDLYYVKNHSIFLDFIILLGTVEVVLLGRGAR